jgi:hypothetical protein
MNVCAVCKTAASPSVVPRTLCRRRSVAPNCGPASARRRLFVVTANIDAQRNLRRLRPINTPDDLQSAAFDAMMLVRAGEVERAQAVDDLYDMATAAGFRPSVRGINLSN